MEDLSSLWSEEDDKEQCERGDDMISLCAVVFWVFFSNFPATQVLQREKHSCLQGNVRR